MCCAACLKFTSIDAEVTYQPETLSQLAGRELQGQCLKYEDQLEKICEVSRQSAQMHVLGLNDGLYKSA